MIPAGRQQRVIHATAMADISLNFSAVVEHLLWDILSVSEPIGTLCDLVREWEN
jgi:hypothetical protein